MILPPCPFCGGASYVAVTLPAHRVLACSKCHIARTDPPPPAIPYEEEDFHAAFPFNSLDELPPDWRRGVDMQAALLRRHLGPKGRVLEIGCGQGFLLAAMVRAGLDATGVEPSKSAAAAAQRNGLNVATGYFTPADYPGPYDAVVLSHVFEHLDHPSKFLADIAASAPGGLLLLAQANWRGLVPRKNQANWHAWAPTHHYWHFFPPGLARWLRTLGVEPVALEFSSLEHSGYWLSRVARWFPGGGDQFHLLARLPSTGLLSQAAHTP